MRKSVTDGYTLEEKYKFYWDQARLATINKDWNALCKYFFALRALRKPKVVDPDLEYKPVDPDSDDVDNLPPREDLPVIN